jgi:HD-GYP domain-containing protein (c-di-GMP phosphodiesterase class II)
MKSMTTGRRVWLSTVALIGGLTVAGFFGPWGDRTYANPDLLFSLVIVSAVACIIGATIVIALADRRELAELGLLGSALMAASVMPLVHGLVTPDVLYNDTAAFRTSMFLSLPIAIAAGAPLLTPHSTFGRWAARHWRDWSLLCLLGVFAIGSVVVAFPDTIVTPDPSNLVTIVVCAALAIGVLMLSRRELRFYGLGGQPANLGASLALVLLATTALLPLTGDDYSLAFWWLHVAGIAGVLGACIAMAVSKRMSKTAHDVLAPVLTRDPLIAFELGLSPAVHRFVASLEGKDPETRDHVIRTTEMAVRVGEHFRLSGRELRNLGLAALLHDIGKLETPIEILEKPSRLTNDEYAIVKRHAVDGERMLLAEPALAGVAAIVRSHHERIDGRGYPDGLTGDTIPLAARIIAVCDAFDAMTHETRFRRAMAPGMAFSVLREHATSQFDDRVIQHVMTVWPAMVKGHGLVAVGKNVDVYKQPEIESNAMQVEDVNELLISVDAEI